MAKDNPSNPFTRDDTKTQRDVPLPLQKARVLSAKPQSASAFHTVRIQVYGDAATFVAPVIMPMPGCSWVPPEGTDVAVLFAAENKPWVVGSWYALDRVETGDVDIPDYDPGEIRVGNASGAHVVIQNDGDVRINSGSNGDVYIDGVKQ
jgi:hypothetical protein